MVFRKRITILATVLAGMTAVLTLLTHLQTAVAAPLSRPFLHTSRPITTTTLYDGTLGGTPDTQEMIYLTQPFPPSQATQTFSNNVTILDTTATNDDYAGYFGNNNVPDLDRTQGYTLHFTIQIDSESHANSNRAGFSVIVLSSDVKGIELGFWQNEVWAQHDDHTGTLFTHGEGTAFDTTTGLIAYELAILSDTYALSTNSTPVLSGTLRDYSNFVGPIDPYETPNLIFLGDDTTSAQARILLAYVAVTANEPPIVDTPTFIYLSYIQN